MILFALRLVPVMLECGAIAAAPDVQTDGNRPPLKRCGDVGHPHPQPYVPVGIDDGDGECPACHGVRGCGHHFNCGGT